MVKHPIMIERPILVHGDAAIVGRPEPKRILSLLEQAGTPSAEAAKATSAALDAVTAAAKGALARGIPETTLERSLLRMAAELNAMQP